MPTSISNTDHASANPVNSNEQGNRPTSFWKRAVSILMCQGSNSVLNAVVDMQSPERMMQISKIDGKSVPYISQKDLKLSAQSVSLNGCALVPAKGGQQQVVCRHLAMAFFIHQGKTRDLMPEFYSKAGIEAYFNGKLTEIEKAYHLASSQSQENCKSLVHSAELGSYMRAIATHLLAHKGDENVSKKVTCLLLTVKHAMVMQVEMKQKSGVFYFSAKLYDPNVTAIYKRVESLNPEGFENLTLEEMIAEKTLISVYNNGKNGPLPMLAVSDAQILTTKTEINEKTPFLSDYMYLALEDGMPNAVEEILNVVLNSTELTVEKKIELLATKKPNGMPGLFMAMQNGHSESVKAFAEAVLNWTELTIDQKIELLAPNRADGTSGLYMAMQQGHSETVKAFAEAVLNSTELTVDQKTELLAAKMADGTSSLFLPMQNGHSETVKAFAEVVLNSTELTVDQKIELLASKKSNGTSGLYQAMQNGHSETVKAFAEAVLNSTELTVDQKTELLAAKRADGTLGLYMAMQHGHSEIVEVFTEAVLNWTELTVDQKTELLAAKRADGASGLYMAMQQGHSATVKAFAEAVLNSTELTVDQKIELLAAKKPNGTPGMFQAMHNGHSETVKAFAEAVLKWTGLTVDQKTELLTARRADGTSGLYQAMKNGHSETVTIFKTLIKKSEQLWSLR
jgi:ankyrin repeat protein